mmetsp:Transcript_16501/g.35660  ORF Transcript_16501/g.35660 Transcript_16501/m.35660 type:complete len:642 (+) Transcript_16501:171-2096(+)|eukprot:CAMPEP_0172312410 /NCGR_PEP_ID=MMETSP1058-20130122/17423_1 /TAXON_ID=83371 /ORGANISM="Detonula confervacea, Strain CCMP 353" /LENGTH=641 /DNA_ID=CAMNT_0013025855 /DNA_START=83 /DNA_END=2008 /DNA_ORIENTATION=-
MSSKRLATSALSQATSNGAILLTCVGTAVAVTVISSRQSSQAEKKRNDGHKLEMYLMDRIANKPYLNYHSASSSAYQQQAKRNYRGRQNEEHSTNTDAIPNNTRPQGVPSRLRLLTVDVPEFKQEAFERGICRTPSEIFDIDKPPIFVDGVAPSKPMNKTLGNNERMGTRASRKPIVQKSLAKQLYYCYEPQHMKRVTNQQSTAHSTEDQTQPSSQHINEEEPVIGVEILEASISDLNPTNIRRTYTSASKSWKKKSYSYDPGKYTMGDTLSNDAADDGSGAADADEAEVEEKTLEQITENQELELSKKDESQPNDDDSEENDIDSPDYERAAPWNQFAWLEEIHLRINGAVPFGSPMERANFLSQWIYGRIYRQPVPASSSRGGWVSWLWWPITWSGSHAVGSQRYRTSWDGIDGEGENVLYGSDAGIVGNISHIFHPRSRAALNRASNKPHAVICDGAAMQRVPGSLRYLTKICREAGIPLYILNDPRSWGSQTHSTLSDALVDMRKTISDNVIRNALDLREGSAFERGKLVGQLEKEIAWQAYDAASKTRDALMDARRRLRWDKVEDDWSQLSEEDLMRKLIERKVVTLQYEGGAGMSDVGAESEGKPRSVKCSDGFLGVCRQCLVTENETQPNEKEP